MTTTEAISQELFDFLERKNVKDVFTHITEQMLMYKPNNAVRFIVKTLQNDFPDEATALEEGEVKIHETFQLYGEGEAGGGSHAREKEFDEGTVRRSENTGAFEIEEVALGNHNKDARAHITEGNSRSMDQLKDENVQRNIIHVFGNNGTVVQAGAGAAAGNTATEGKKSTGPVAEASESKSDFVDSGAAPNTSSSASAAANAEPGGLDDPDVDHLDDADADAEPLPSDAELVAQFGHLFPVLEKHALFASMERWEWLQVCRNLEEVLSRKHDMVCKMGEAGPAQDYFYIVESGTVEVFVMKDVDPPPEKEETPKERETREREAMRKQNLSAMGLKDDVKVQKKKDRESQIQEELHRKQREAARKGTVKRQKKVLATYTRGDTFGELALLYPCRREASVLVTSPKAAFWRLSRKAFKVLSNFFMHERVRRRLALINNVQIFSPLSSVEKATVADALEIETFQKGDVIIQQGAVHEKLIIVSEGTVSLSQRNKVGRQVELCQIRAGHAFAEHALLTMRPSQMSAIVASEHVQCYTLTKTAFIQSFGAMTDVLQRDPTLNSNMMAMLI